MTGFILFCALFCEVLFRYGPRPVDRRVGFTEEGVLTCEVYRGSKVDKVRAVDDMWSIHDR